MTDRKLVEEIVRNVRFGIRTKAELRRCGCESCREALRILGKREAGR